MQLLCNFVVDYYSFRITEDEFGHFRYTEKMQSKYQ